MEETKKTMMVASAFLAVCFGVLGAISVADALMPGVAPAVFGVPSSSGSMAGLIHLLTAAILAVGVVSSSKGSDDDTSFVLVGCGLASLLLLVQVILLLTDMSMAWVIGSEDYADWAVLDSLSLSMPFGILAFLVLNRSRRVMEVSDGRTPAC